MQNNQNESLAIIEGLTKKLSVALEQGDLDEVGSVIDERQTAIDAYNSLEDKKPLTKEQIDMLNGIIETDKQIYALADEIAVNLKKKFLLFKKTNLGLLKYKKNEYNTASGQIVDKKR